MSKVRRAVIDGGGNPVMVGGWYDVSGSPIRAVERVYVRKITRGGSVVVLVINTGAVSDGCVVRVSAGELSELSFASI